MIDLIVLLNLKIVNCDETKSALIKFI